MVFLKAHRILKANAKLTVFNTIEVNRMHYDNEREAELENVDMSHYTKHRWFDEIYVYLRDVMSMNDQQIKEEFDKRFSDLLP